VKEKDDKSGYFVGRESGYSRVWIDENAHYKEVIELAADAFFEGDEKGNIVFANNAAVGLTGFSLGELCAMNMADFFSEEEVARNPLRYDLLKKYQIVQNERVLTRKDGTGVSVWMNSRMMPDGTYHSFMRDNTDRKEIENGLRRVVSNLEHFSYSISHDLRNYLSSIVGYLDVISDEYGGDLKSNGLEMLGQIGVAAENMVALTDNLLAMSRAESAQRPSNSVDVGDVLRCLQHDLKFKLDEFGVDVQSKSLPLMDIPEVLISQVLQNFIVNALLYASKSGYTITVGGNRDSHSARIFVADQGEGVCLDDGEKIFSMHYRGKASSGKAGSGLGLGIVSKIAQSYGGRTWVENLPEGGSCFWFEVSNMTQDVYRDSYRLTHPPLAG